MADTTPTPAGSDASELPRLSEARLRFFLLKDLKRTRAEGPGAYAEAGREVGQRYSAACPDEERAMARELLAARERIAELEKAVDRGERSSNAHLTRAFTAEFRCGRLEAKIKDLQSSALTEARRIAEQGEAAIGQALRRDRTICNLPARERLALLAEYIEDALLPDDLRDKELGHVLEAAHYMRAAQTALLRRETLDRLEARQ